MTSWGSGLVVRTFLSESATFAAATAGAAAYDAMRLLYGNGIVC